MENQLEQKSLGSSQKNKNILIISKAQNQWKQNDSLQKRKRLGVGIVKDDIQIQQKPKHSIVQRTNMCYNMDQNVTHFNQRLLQQNDYQYIQTNVNNNLESNIIGNKMQFESQISNFNNQVDYSQIHSDEEKTNQATNCKVPNYYSNQNYHQKFWKIYVHNEVLMLQIKHLLSEIQDLNMKLEQYQTNLDQKEKEMNRNENENEDEKAPQQGNKKKKYRRTAADIEKQFECPYPRCNKSYGSDVSLNLHIKIKHGGGNKTERRKLAKQIILNSQTGNNLPKVDINFPPNYLNQFQEQINIIKNQKEKVQRDVDLTQIKPTILDIDPKIDQHQLIKQERNQTNNINNFLN